MGRAPRKARSSPNRNLRARSRSRSHEQHSRRPLLSETPAYQKKHKPQPWWMRETGLGKRHRIMVVDDAEDYADDVARPSIEADKDDGLMDIVEEQDEVEPGKVDEDGDAMMTGVRVQLGELKLADRGAHRVQGEPGWMSSKIKGKGKAEPNLWKERFEGDIEPVYKLQLQTHADLNLDEARQQQMAKALELETTHGWTKADVMLKTRLVLRSFGSTLPIDFKRDFPGLPDQFFSADRDAVFMKNLRPERDTSFTRSLLAMMKVGMHVRESVACDDIAAADRRLRTAAADCIRFGQMDACSKNLPNVVVVPACKPAHADKAAVKALESLRDLWTAVIEIQRGHTPIFPPLYAVSVSATTVAIVSYKQPTAIDWNPLRKIEVFNYSDECEDVWNAFAVMTLAVHARDELINFKESFAPVGWKPPTSDPDL